MYTLYHAVWSLAAIAVYLLGVAIIHRQWSSVNRLLGGIGLATAAYLPWAVYAIPQFLARAAAESATNIGQQFPIIYFIQQGIADLTMSQQLGIVGPVVSAAIIGAGILVALIQKRSLTPLVLPAFMIAFTLIGVAFAARQWAFNARMLIGAVPALALALAWAFDQLLTHPSTRSGRPAARCLS